MGFDIRQPITDRNGEYDEKKAASYREQLLDLFEHSPEGMALTQAGEYLTWVDTLLEFGMGYLDVTPPNMTPADMRTILFEIIPNKVVTPPDEAHAIIRELQAFWRFLGREFALPNADACLKALDDAAARRLKQALSNPANFGMAKSMVMMGMERGFDVSTPEGIEQWIATYNAEMQAGIGSPIPLRGERRQGAEKAREKMKRKMQKASRRQNRKRKK